MVKHIVMWRAKNPADKAKTLLQVQDKLLSLKEKLPAGIIETLQTGINSEQGTGSHDIVLITEHKSWQALEAYQNHPEHKKVAEFIKEHVTDRSCVDFEY